MPSLLLWLAVAVLVLIILFLVMPLRLRLSLRTDPALRSFLVVWPFGGALRVPIFDTSKKSQQKPPKKARKKRHTSKPARHRTKALTALPKVLGQMIRTIDIEDLCIDSEFGMGDPADTGHLYGYLTPLIYTTNGSIHLRPNFHETCLRGRADLQCRVIPLAFLWPLTGLVWHMFGPIQ